MMLYIGNASSFPPPLSTKEEQKYFALFQAGDLEAKSILVERNLRLIAHIIKKYYSNAKDQEDLISIGTIGLIKAINTFDSKKGTRFATYAARCIENAILSKRPHNKACQNKKTAPDMVVVWGCFHPSVI
jgi:RNA polymerase sporulation-specific sigma factor